MFAQGILAHLSPFRKLLVFTLLALGSMLFFMLLAWAGAWLVYGAGFIPLVSDLTRYEHQPVLDLLKYFQIVNQMGLFIIPPLLFAYLDSTNVPGYLRLNRPAAISTLLLSILILFASQPLIHWLYDINKAIHFPHWLNSLEEWMKSTEETTEKLTRAFLQVQTTGGLILNFVMIALLPAIGEEFFFRGVIQKLLYKWFHSKHMAVILTAIAFSALHMQFYGFLPRTALGVIFGYLFIATGSIWVPVLVHFVNNGAAVLITFLKDKGKIETDYLDVGNVTGLWWVVGSLVLIVLLFFSLSENMKRVSRKNL